MAQDRTNVISDFKICYNRIHVGTLHLVVTVGVGEKFPIEESNNQF